MRSTLRFLATSLVLALPAHGAQVDPTFRDEIAQSGHSAQLVVGG